MRNSICFNDRWTFTDPKGAVSTVSLPHTWNGVDGQDGGNDYRRGTGYYRKRFPAPGFQAGAQRVYLEFQGVNASARVTLNGGAVCGHDGGYSTFRADVTDLLRDENDLEVAVDNSVNQTVYPQKADFTFYGGIYRDVLLRVVPAEHFDLDFWGTEGIKITPAVDGRNGRVRVETFHNAAGARVRVTLLDGAGKPVAEGEGQDVTLTIPSVRLWDGVKDPYRYTAVAELLRDGEPLDRVETRFGVRTFRVDPEQGFFLNGRHYPPSTASPAIRTARVWATPSPRPSTGRTWSSCWKSGPTPSASPTTSTTSSFTTCATSTASSSGPRSPTSRST